MAPGLCSPSQAWGSRDNRRKKKGTLYRAWQPFNGLQVFPNGTNEGPERGSFFLYFIFEGGSRRMPRGVAPPSERFLRRQWTRRRQSKTVARRVPAGKFSDAPPALCKKGGATFRVKCNDDGYPQTAAQLGEAKRALKKRSGAY